MAIAYLSRARAARPSAWAGISPRRFRRLAACSTRSTRRLAKSCPKLIWEGPEETLTLTANAQPALMAVDSGDPRPEVAWFVFKRARSPSRRPFARRIFGARGRRHVFGRRSGQAAAYPRQRHAGGSPRWRWRHGGYSRAGRAGRSRRPVLRPHPARSARSPTTMAAGNWSFQAKKPPSSALRSFAPTRAPTLR